jgi:hypothetical protein
MAEGLNRSDILVARSSDMPKLDLIALGATTGVVIPEEILARMRVKQGDSLFAVETPEGYLLTAFDPEIEEQMELGREGMKQFRETYIKLAKGSTQ